VSFDIVGDGMNYTDADGFRYECHDDENEFVTVQVFNPYGQVISVQCLPRAVYLQIQLELTKTEVAI